MKVRLTCGHELDLNPPPHDGDELWCYKCQSVSEYDGKAVVYRIRCVKCVHGKTYGSDRPEAYRQAAAHLRRYPQHVMKIFNTGKLEYTMKDPTEEIPGIDLTVIQWNQQHPSHQTTLKRITLPKQT